VRILKGLAAKAPVSADSKGVTGNGFKAEELGAHLFKIWELDAGLYGFRVALILYIVK
jgi:hypothetical protein